MQLPLNNILELNRSKEDYDQDEIRMRQQEWLYDYYVSDREEIIAYLEDSIRTVLGSEIILKREWLYDYVNITKKVIDALAVVYKEPADRYITSESELDKTPKTDYLLRILPENINTLDKQAHRFA